MKEKVGIISEKRTDFFGLLKNLFGDGSSQSKGQEETISESQDISESDRKILLQSLKKYEKLAEKTFSHNTERPKKSKIKKDVEVTLQEQPENSQQAKLISEHDEREH